MATEIISPSQSCGNCSAVLCTLARQKAINVIKRRLEFMAHRVLYRVGSGSSQEPLAGLMCENVIKRTVCAFAVATMICGITYGMSHAAPIAGF